MPHGPGAPGPRALDGPGGPGRRRRRGVREDLERAFLEHVHQVAEAFLRGARVRGGLPPGSWPGPRRPARWAGPAGSPSPAAFRAQFLRATGVSPDAYRALVRPGAPAAFTLALPGGYRAEDVLAYHGRDPLSRSERVEGSTLTKALAMAGGTGAGAGGLPARGTADCRVLAPAAPAPAELAGIHRRVARMLGLAGGSGALRAVRGRIRPAPAGGPAPGPAHPPDRRRVGEPGVGGAGPAGEPGVRLQRCAGASPSAAARRPRAGLLAHPAPAAVAALEPGDLQPLQFSRSKAEYVVALARKAAAGELPLEDLPLGTATGAGLKPGGGAGHRSLDQPLRADARLRLRGRLRAPGRCPA